MELRRLSLCLAFLLVAVISHSSEARHSLERREADVDFFQDDPGSDNEQNDEGEDEDGPIPNATILTKPEVYKVPIGKGVRLECRIDIPDTMVTWMRGDIGLVVLGTQLADPNKYQKNGTDLIIHNVVQADAGGYQCKVEQTPPVQIEHQIVVEQAAQITSISASDDGKPAPGSDLTLSCSATGIPAPKIIWSKLVNGQNAKIGEGAVHTIKNVKAEDSGTYYCYAMGTTNADTKTIEVSVRRKPNVHVHRSVINSAIGVEAFMRCNVHEQEPVSIRWFKGDQEIDPSRYTTQGTESNFTVVPQSDADFGTYTCRAECVFGTHHRSIELVETPVVERLESDGSKLSWSVHSHLPLRSIEIQLIDTVNGTSKNIEVPVPDQKTHEYDFTYVVNSVQPGLYDAVVKVENSKGMGENSLPVELKDVGPSPGAAHAHSPTTALISTVLMYLLVRML
ncbi:lachesin-like isoform X2 [Leguminivora glycinivorella]|uniref:lachesin-like isoform X2 n=1 Tax=Leguminivora glycinivorella TaxID=1035111 RepID=UPI00200BE86E|nr:lachesin-like isoform X2 [Leguminivora glycinivorella]